MSNHKSFNCSACAKYLSKIFSWIFARDLLRESMAADIDYKKKMAKICLEDARLDSFRKLIALSRDITPEDERRCECVIQGMHKQSNGSDAIAELIKCREGEQELETKTPNSNKTDRQS